MRKNAKKDLNHDEVCGAFRELGCFVLDLYAVGNGLPDIFVEFRKIWHPVEIKSNTHYGRKGLNRSQMEMHLRTSESFRIARSAEDARRLVKAWSEGKDVEELKPKLRVVA